MSAIAAIATPDAPGGISVIRISGEDALKIASLIFKSAGGKSPEEMEGYTCVTVEELFRIQGVEPENGVLYASPTRLRPLAG